MSAGELTRCLHCWERQNDAKCHLDCEKCCHCGQEYQALCQIMRGEKKAKGLNDLEVIVSEDLKIDTRDKKILKMLEVCLTRGDYTGLDKIIVLLGKRSEYERKIGEILNNFKEPLITNKSDINKLTE